jgi:hypothetical protein
MKARVRAAHTRLQDNVATVALLALGVGVLASLVAVGALYQSQDTREIIYRSPCLLNPAGEECQQAQRRADLQRSIADTCIPFRRAGYVPCPKGRKRQVDSREARRLENGSRGEATSGLGRADRPPPGGDTARPGERTSGGTEKPPRSRKPQPQADSPVQPNGHAPAPLPETDSDAQPNAPSVPDQFPPPSSPPSKPGLLGDPGGLVGDVVCVVNRLGLPLCTD